MKNRRNSQSGSVLILVLGLIVLAGLGYFLFSTPQLSKNKNNLPRSTPIVGGLLSPNPTVTSPESKQGSTGVNGEARVNDGTLQTLSLDNLQFKVPSNWSFRKYEYNKPASGVSYLLSPRPIPDNSDASSTFTIIHQPKTTLTKRRSEIVKDYYLDKVKEKQITLQGYTGVVLDGVIQPGPNIVPLPAGDTVRSVIYQVGGDIYEINEIGLDQNKIFDQILLTFKFTQ